MNQENFSVKLDQKPSCELTEQWRTTEIDGQELMRAPMDTCMRSAQTVGIVSVSTVGGSYNEVDANAGCTLLLERKLDYNNDACVSGFYQSPFPGFDESLPVFAFDAVVGDSRKTCRDRPPRPALAA
jgi:hypothetical protein